VRIRFQNSDGLVFLSRGKPAITLDGALLGETDRLDLEQLVRAARFFDLPEQTAGNLNGGPAWYITIEEGGRQHSVTVGQPVQGPAMRKLVERLRKLGASQARMAKRSLGGPATATLVRESPVPESGPQADRRA
jgi:Emfourin